jgi:PAS domain S-box-containing protein
MKNFLHFFLPRTVKQRIAFLVVTIFVPVISVFAITSFLALQNSYQQGRQQASWIADRIANEEMDAINRTKMVLSILSANQAVREALQPQCTNLFKSIMNIQPWLISIWISDISGHVLCSNEIIRPVAERGDFPEFKQAIATDRFTVVDARKSINRLDAYVIPFAAPLKNSDGKLIGAIGATMSADWVGRIAEQEKATPATDVALINHLGETAFDLRQPDRTPGSGFPKGLEHSGDPGFIEYLRTISLFGKESYVLGRSMVEDAGITILVAFPLSEVPHQIVNWELAGAAGVILCLILSLTAFGSLVRLQFEDPVMELARQARNFVPGHRFQSPAFTRATDEIKTLVGDFDGMAAELNAHETALNEAHDELQAIMDNTVDGLVLIDEKGFILRFSKGAEKIFGYAAAEVIGKNVSMLMPEPYRSMHNSYIAAYVLTNVAKVIGIGREITGQHKDGSTFPLDLSIGEIKNGHDGSRFIGTLRDISTRVSMERQLRQAQKMEAVGQLVGGVAHDFNNILAVILGNMELLGESANLDHRERKHFDSALHATERGADLTGKLLAFSRQMPLKPTQFDVDCLIPDVTKLLTRTLGETIKVTFESDKSPHWIQADDGQFENAILNLAINARDAMPAGGNLKVSVSRYGSDLPRATLSGALEDRPYVCITITDSGTGIPPDVLQHIFEPFFTTKAIGKGSGLGLSMVYGFVTQSGGQVDVQSVPNQGTSIRLLFPEFEPEKAIKEEEPTKPNKASPIMERVILLVEDNADVRAVIAEQLKNLGYRVRVAEDGEEARSILEADQPLDIVLTDIVLSGSINGLGVGAIAERMRSGIRVIYMSGYTASEDILETIQSQNLPFISKPFSRDRLREILTDAKENPRSAA